MLDEKVIYFAGEDETVKIPTKRDEDGAYDIYANFKEDLLIIRPHETIKINTKLHSAFSKKYRAILGERGSTGTIGMAQRAGVIDSGYRGEWLVPITNTTVRPMVIAKSDIEEKQIYSICRGYGFDLEPIIYPYKKAVCQVMLEEVPELEVRVMSLQDLMNIPSERGTGRLGSSGK